MIINKQLILVKLTFLFALFVLSISLWLETALPILKDYLNLAMVKFENGYAFLKFISGHIADIFRRIYEQFVLKSG
jgi:hypothetical protein